MQIEHEVVIHRPRAEVFAFVGDQDHLPAWTSGVARVKCTTSGPVGVGTTYAVTGRSLGRKVEATYELTEFEPSTRFVGRMESKLFTIEQTYVFEGDGGRTTVQLTATATARGRMRLLGPLLGLAVERQIKVDHQRLKTILERKRRRPPAPKKARAAAAAPVTEAATEG